MFSVLVALMPLIIGSALVPLQIILIILLLTGDKQGPLKAIMFVLGMTFIRVAQGIVFGFILGGGSAEATAGSDGPANIKSTLLLILGVILLISAYKSFTHDPDPDAPPPKWLTMIETASPLMALVLGAGLILISAKLWVFTLSAISSIEAAGLGQPDSIITFLLFVLLAESLLIISIIIRLLLPTKAAVWLETFSTWLEVHNDTIVTVVSLIFGVLILSQGIIGLLG